MLRDANWHDAQAICQIYNPYIAHTTITFEEYPVRPMDIERRIRDVQERALPWLVWEDQGHIVAYAYVRPWQTRSAYRYTVESSVYVDQQFTGKGIGRRIYGELLRRVDTMGIHAVVGCVAMPNEPSVLLHQKLGFQRVGCFPEVGRKFDRWIDVEYWQMIFEGGIPGDQFAEKST
jgi:L-amino acid N-acyltransferase YncA